MHNSRNLYLCCPVLAFLLKRILHKKNWSSIIKSNYTLKIIQKIHSAATKIYLFDWWRIWYCKKLFATNICNHNVSFYYRNEMSKRCSHSDMLAFCLFIHIRSKITKTRPKFSNNFKQLFLRWQMLFWGNCRSDTSERWVRDEAKLSYYWKIPISPILRNINFQLNSYLKNFRRI